MTPTAELIKEYIGGISDTAVAELLTICEIRNYEANDIVYREHADSTHLFIVHSGQIDIQYKTPSGSRETTDTCGKGDFLIWSALIVPHKTTSIGICRSRAELLAFDAVKLREICSKDTAFGYQMMTLIAGVVRRRLQAARKEILEQR